MASLGLSEKTIANTTLYIDNHRHITILGSVWPKYLSRLRYPRLKPTGSVIRLSRRLYFTGPTYKTINHTLVHEIEHAAQIQRKDPRLLIGYLTQVVGVGAGIALGLTNQSDVIVFKVMILFITALFGLYAGYMFSLHEMQARKRSIGYKLKQPLIQKIDSVI